LWELFLFHQRLIYNEERRGMERDVSIESENSLSIPAIKQEKGVMLDEM
jgi:hypothetical protein